jgi:predicted dehydrogenase
VAEFIRSIVQNIPFNPDFEDGVKCQEVLEAVEQSALNRTWVKI